jgi:urea transporter
MNDQSAIGSAKMSTVGGILTVIFMNINAVDIMKTAVLATIGAVVSFFISILLKYLLSRWRK